MFSVLCRPNTSSTRVWEFFCFFIAEYVIIDHSWQTNISLKEGRKDRRIEGQTNGYSQALHLMTENAAKLPEILAKATVESKLLTKIT